MNIPEQLIEQVKQDEGLRLTAYWDPIGKCFTIGYGHTGRDVQDAMTITQARADALLARDLTAAGADLDEAFPWAEGLGVIRHAVLWNMTFNMGIDRLRGFHEALAAAEAGQWDACAAQMLDSLWAQQVGGRATRLAQQMRTNGWVMA